MQLVPQNSTPAPRNRAGCVAWLALIIAIIGLLMDFVQEMAWDRMIDEASSAMTQRSSTDSNPVDIEPNALAVLDTPVSQTAQAAESHTPSPTNTEIPTETPRPSDTPLPTLTPIPTATPLPRIGVDVVVGNVRWKALEVQDLGQTLTSDNSFTDDKSTGGKFIRVLFAIENLGNEPLHFDYPDLVDSQGRTFATADGVYSFIPDDMECFILDTLQPRVPRTCMLIFETAADASGFKLYVGDLELFGGDEAYIDLGL